MAGPQIYLFRLIKKLQLDSRIIFPYSGKEFKNLLDLNHLRNTQVYLSAPSIKMHKIVLYVLTFIPEIIYLTFYLFLSKENIIYIGGGAWQIKGVIAAKLSFKKVVWHLNDTSMPLIVRVIFFLLSRFADGFIFASKASKNYYSNLIPDRPTAVIPSPVDSEYTSDKVNPIFSQEGKRIIGMVANVNPIKNLEDFILIAEELNAIYSDLHFVIIGPIYDSQKKYYQKLKRMIIDLELKNISFIGPVENVFLYLKGLDIFLFTSKSESSPLAIWEAMYSECPVVTYEVGDVKEYINHMKSGYVAELFDRDDLINGVIQLLNNKELSSSIGKEAKKVVEAELSSQTCATRHLDYFNKLL